MFVVADGSLAIAEPWYGEVHACLKSERWAVDIAAPFGKLRLGLSTSVYRGA